MGETHTRRSFLAASAGVLARGAAPDTYLPDWRLLRRHNVPAWFEDAKLGIFIHWGLYSVPGWAPTTGEYGQVPPDQWFRNNPYAEWYLNSMKIQGSPTWFHHHGTYGAKFDYLDFAPMFERAIEKWDPNRWADVFQQAGARYVVMVTKHHDGFTMWPSRVHNRHRRADRQGVRGDLAGELTRAVRARGMKMGLYYSGGLDWSFVGTPILSMQDLYRNVPQTAEYARYADAHWRELIERYQPSMLWNDISYPQRGDLVHLFADYYNRVPEGVINNRFGAAHEDFTTPEYSRYDRIVEKKWESCRGLGYSFGYNRNEGPDQVISAPALIRLLADITSKNGNLLLNVGPMADGTIPEIQLDRLRVLGAWLKRSGEAIYGTRPWVRPQGKLRDGVEIRFTQSRDSVYAILMDRPPAREIVLNRLWPEPDTRIEMLGTAGPLEWSREDINVRLRLPADLPGSYAWVLKFTPKPWLLVRD